MPWIKATPLERIAGAPAVVKQGRQQVAVLKVGPQVFAIDNRCPHEGYPLAAGSVSGDCVLTCNWHNWKFRLSDGECLVGGDHVRTYATRVEDGDVWVDISPLPAEQAQQQALRGLRAAFDDRDYGRLCREIARLDYQALDPLLAVRSALEWSHDRLEFGTTHGTAAMVDWLQLAERWPDDRERRLICLAEAVDHLSFDSLRHEVHPYAETGVYFAPTAFQSCLEAEDVPGAEAMVRRGLEDELRWSDMETAFLGAALAHYYSFGHSLIYVLKVGQALQRLGRAVAPFLVLPLARQIGYATREDLIPEFRAYRPSLDTLPEPLPTQTGSPDEGRPEVPFPATLRQAFDWLRTSLTTHAVDRVYDALLEALALSLLHYDAQYGTAFDRPVTQNVGWLDFTHGITFANAVRQLCDRHPTFWRAGLLQMACFLGRNEEFLDRTVDRQAWHVADAPAFLTETCEHLLDHGLRDPIVAAHHLKTTVAVEEELALASRSCQEAMLDGLNRFLHSPIKMKHVRREARQALALTAPMTRGAGR